MGLCCKDLLLAYSAILLFFLLFIIKHYIKSTTYHSLRHNLIVVKRVGALWPDGTGNGTNQGYNQLAVNFCPNC